MRPLALNAYRTWPTGDLVAKILNFFNVKIDLQNVQVGTAVEFPSPSNTGQYLAILASTVSSTTLCAKLNADSTLQASITQYIIKRNVYAFQRAAKKIHLQLPKLLCDKLYISETIPYTFSIHSCQYWYKLETLLGHYNSI